MIEEQDKFTRFCQRYKEFLNSMSEEFVDFKTFLCVLERIEDKVFIYKASDLQSKSDFFYVGSYLQFQKNIIEEEQRWGVLLRSCNFNVIFVDDTQIEGQLTVGMSYRVTQVARTEFGYNFILGHHNPNQSLSNSYSSNRFVLSHSETCEN